MTEKKRLDPIEKARRKLEEAMIKRKTRRLVRNREAAPPPEARPKVLLIVRPRVREPEPETLEDLMARRLAEARRRISGATTRRARRPGSSSGRISDSGSA